ncbi:MAG: acetate--CoA ligase family protein [Deltaproteobacteria bacterium]|nr:acetate--CoA ligase family protein [Deltaproteobacteria bacterium]
MNLFQLPPHLINLFQGTRGENPKDIDALVNVLLKASNLGMSCKDKLSEMDINPLITFEKGAGAVAAG